MFDKLLKIAKDTLMCTEEKADGLPMPQVSVLFTNQDNFYVAVNDVDGSICSDLKKKKDTKIVWLLTVWKNGCIDLPSMALRKELVKLDASNLDANLILQGADGYIVKKLSVTM